MYLLNILLILFPILSILGDDWGYDKNNGPHTWGGTCKTGKKQSPVDIVTEKLVERCSLPLRLYNYNLAGDVVVENTGHGVEISGFKNWKNKQPFIAYGNFVGRYFLEQLNFHWSTNRNGSEHTINGRRFAAEVHYVYVKEGYTYEEALKRPDGIVISAIFLEIGGNGHALSIIEKYLPQVVLYRKTVKIPNFIVGFSIPDKWNEYYRYDGSFTRPNCAEVVNWIILPGPVQFTQKQLDLFRKIEGPNGKALGSNVRPTQPLNQRRVEHRPPNC